MLDLKDEDHPANRRAPAAPLTRLQKDQGVIVVLSFVVWLPVYLFWVRAAVNGFVFKYVDGYPAMLHLFPLIGVPCLLALAYARLAGAWRRYE